MSFSIIFAVNRLLWPVNELAHFNMFKICRRIRCWVYLAIRY